jgi:hypothetical protein
MSVNMPARATAPNSQQTSSYASYHESPLRTVQLQTDTKPSHNRPALSSDASRRDSARSLQNTIYNALGSSQPVDLLPHLSKPRVSRSYRRQTVLVSDADEVSTPSVRHDSMSNTDTLNLDGSPSAAQQEQNISRTMENNSSVFDEVLYATPPGCGHERGSR